jgi:hypothetical protein
MAILYRNEKELFKILNLADKRLTPKRFKKALEGLPPNYDLNSVVKKLRTIEIDDQEEEDQENTDQYPYPPKKKRKIGYPYSDDNEEPEMPKIVDGKISIEDLISYLEQLSKFKKAPFNYTRCKEILNKNYIAFKKKD